jgi:3'-phosphoadenosine 5'-phosphosulfate sulfotransferase (PAPS reductase)/FAD synthetase
VSDPFRIEGPAIINVSGGRTSALMLRRILDAHGGALPADVHACFQNTGKELEETLEFVRDLTAHWGVPIHWIEYGGRDLRAPHARAVIDGVVRLPHMEVTFETASRKGEPFDRIIREKSYLPNGVTRFCTQEMKILPGRNFMRALGCDRWTSVLGLRRDEPRRVANVRANEPDEWDVACPLYDGGVTKADVESFWRSQPFDLRLRPWESNCGGCFLKSAAILERVERDRPGTLAWWDAWEKRNGATFANGRPFAKIVARASLPVLPGFFDSPPDEDGTSIPCNCTD